MNNYILFSINNITFICRKTESSRSNYTALKLKLLELLRTKQSFCQLEVIFYLHFKEKIHIT